MLVAPTRPLPLAGHWRGPDNTKQLGWSSTVATMHNLSFIPYFFLYGRSRRPPLRYAICHWHVFQMCFSLARRVWITGGQGKQTVVLLYRLRRGFAESEWTRQMCFRALIRIWVCGNTKRQLFPEKSKGFLSACAENALTLKEWASSASPGWPGGYFFYASWLDHLRQLRARCCLRWQGLGSALKEILTNRSNHWKNRVYSPSLFHQVFSRESTEGSISSAGRCNCSAEGSFEVLFILWSEKVLKAMEWPDEPCVKIRSDGSGSPICTTLKIKDLGLGWVIYHKVFCEVLLKVGMLQWHFSVT